MMELCSPKETRSALMSGQNDDKFHAVLKRRAEAKESAAEAQAEASKRLLDVARLEREMFDTNPKLASELLCW